jgi:pseudaminic acid biosynthesis-associated methylase
MLTEQEQFWAGDFGSSYTQRNGIANWRARVPFWADIIARTGARSILEVGCNAGMNLRAIRQAAPEVHAWGCDINQAALQQAADDGHSVVEASVFDFGDVWWERFDLTATVGVLIHISPADIERAMRAIIASSKKYVLAVEYADEWEVEVSYRGHSERLWRRPFGQMYQDFGLNLVAEFDAPADAFDRCRAWILSRP